MMSALLLAWKGKAQALNVESGEEDVQEVEVVVHIEDQHWNFSVVEYQPWVEQMLLRNVKCSTL